MHKKAIQQIPWSQSVWGWAKTWMELSCCNVAIMCFHPFHWAKSLAMPAFPAPMHQKVDMIWLEEFGTWNSIGWESERWSKHWHCSCRHDGMRPRIRLLFRFPSYNLFPMAWLYSDTILIYVTIPFKTTTAKISLESKGRLTTTLGRNISLKGCFPTCLEICLHANKPKFYTKKERIQQSL